MKKLLKKTLIFTCIVIILIVILEILSINIKTKDFINFITNTNGYSLDTTIEKNIEKVQDKKEYKYLILGDSVASELFPGLQDINDDVCIATSIAGIGMVGQYVLLNEFINNHPQTKEVYLVLRYSSVYSTFDKKWGYQYAVIPLVHKELINMLDSDTIDIIKTTYGSFCLNDSFVELLFASDLDYRMYLNYIMRRNVGEYDGFELGFCYLKKMKKLCDEHDIKFCVYSDPVSDDDEVKQKIDELRNKVDEYALEDVFNEYFQTVKYYPVDMFRDGVHFVEEMENRNDMNRIIVEMYENTKLFDILGLE